MVVRRSSTTRPETPKRRSTSPERTTSRPREVSSGKRTRTVTGVGINSISAHVYLVPVAGYVTSNAHVKTDQMDTYGIRGASKRLLRLSEVKVSRLNQYQKSANAAGFLVALACPADGEIVKTRRTAELDDGVAAECPKCGKKWVIA